MGCALIFSGQGAAVVQGPVVEFTAVNRASVRWATDVACGTRVRFGLVEDKLDRRAEGELGTNHVVVLDALKPGAKYFYVIGTARQALATNSFTTAGTGSALAMTEAPAKASTKFKSPVAAAQAPPTRETWGNVATLPDHFHRHGGDFQARNPDDYARMAWEFLQRARAGELLVKVDEEGVIRVFDPKTRAFAAYNRDGTTRTFFKPDSRGYFDRQPGKIVKSLSLK